MYVYQKKGGGSNLPQIVATDCVSTSETYGDSLFSSFYAAVSVFPNYLLFSHTPILMLGEIHLVATRPAVLFQNQLVLPQ